MLSSYKAQKDSNKMMNLIPLHLPTSKELELNYLDTSRSPIVTVAHKPSPRRT